MIITPYKVRNPSYAYTNATTAQRLLVYLSVMENLQECGIYGSGSSKNTTPVESRVERTIQIQGLKQEKPKFNCLCRASTSPGQTRNSYIGYYRATERGGLQCNKQGCHHLQSTSTNRGMLQQSYSSLGTTPTLLFTSSSSSQEHPSLSGVLNYSYPLLLVNAQSSKQFENTS